MKNELIYEPICSTDYAVLTKIMTRAFDEDTFIHTGENAGGPNGYNDGSLLERLNNDSDYETYKILHNTVIIGAYTISKKEDQVYCLEILFLDTCCRGKQMGKKVWLDIEERHSNAKKWVVETPSYSTRNHDFYTRKCGFEILEEKEYGNGAKSMIFTKVF